MAVADKAATILNTLEKAAGTHGVDIVDVECVGATKAPCVRVRIDWFDESKGGISLDDVAAQTKWISDCLDELDPFSGSYTLEVSSPGLDRPLRREHDFERFCGETVCVTTNATTGRKKFTGTLQGMRDGYVVVSTSEGEENFALADIKRCTIKPSFDTNPKK